MSQPKQPLRQCMFVNYARSNENKTDDALIIKERLRDPVTGRERPNIRIVENYKRPFGITKKNVQAEHKQKREYEYVENLNMHECTQAELPFRVAKALGKGGGYYRMSELAREPYVYGTDIPSTVLYRSEQDTKNKALNGSWVADYSMAVMDFETNTHDPKEDILSGALSYKDKAVIVATHDFVKGVTDPEEKLQKCIMKYLEKDVVKREMKIKVMFVDNEYLVVKELMKICHMLKPDFLSFWNMQFDIKKIITACERYNKDPAFLFSDPAIPAKYRHFKWREDAVNKTSVSGKKMNKDPSEAWHVVECPASFYVIDSMCVFRMLRVIQGKRHSYSLDAILNSELGIRKLDIPGVEGDHNLNWHRKMQKGKPVEYLVYNLFDCISVELLDEVTKDLAKKVGLYADGSDFGSLASNPKRLANAIHIYLQDKGMMLCSTSDNMMEPEDKYILDKKDWIVTLANELADESGIALFEELPYLLSRVAIAVADIDITSGYPTVHSVANISKSTTLAEVCTVKGLDRAGVKQLAVDLMAAPANALEISNRLLNLPTIEEWDDIADEELGEAKVVAQLQAIMENSNATKEAPMREKETA